jgi:hypothetical protein
MNKSRKFAALFVINILLMIFSSVARAQVDDNEEDGLYLEKPRLISVGLIGGTNFSQVDGDSYAGYHKIGANFGGIGYIRLYRHVAFSFEALYSQKGAKSNGYRYSINDSTTIIGKYGIKLNYVEIPLMINYFDQRKSHFGLGMSINRLVSSNEYMTAYPAYTIDFTKYPFRKESFDLVAGAQMHVWKGLFFNIRFQYALSPVRTYSPADLSRAQRQFSNLWTVRMMYLFL